MSDSNATELESLSKLKMAGKLKFWRGTIEIDEAELHAICDEIQAEHEQAVAATLGRRKAKSHPYGYEPDTGCFDATRCECGCLNDISAMYCNDCGGEIEIDMNAEKEVYEYNRNSVFAVKHDDGTLEFGGKKYVAATLGAGECVPKERFDELAEAYDKMADQSASLAAELNARAEPPYDKLLRCLENDYGIKASWDGLRKFWYVEQKPEKPCGGNYCPLCGANERTCTIEGSGYDELWDESFTDLSCGHRVWEFEPKYCVECGAKVVDA